MMWWSERMMWWRERMVWWSERMMRWRERMMWWRERMSGKQGPCTEATEHYIVHRFPTLYRLGERVQCRVPKPPGIMCTA